jgi:hypothetical protein
MRITCKNRLLEKVLIGVNVLAAAAVVATFVALFGFDKPLLPAGLLYAAQVALLFVFVGEKIARFLNAASKAEFWQTHWFEIPLLLALALVVSGAGSWFAKANPAAVQHPAVGVYLVLQDQREYGSIWQKSHANTNCEFFGLDTFGGGSADAAPSVNRRKSRLCGRPF